MDGSNRTTIIKSHILGWPNALVVDLWVDRYFLQTWILIKKINTSYSNTNFILIFFYNSFFFLFIFFFFFPNLFPFFFFYFHNPIFSPSSYSIFTIYFITFLFLFSSFPSIRNLFPSFSVFFFYFNPFFELPP